jgi:uncharacterized protein (DUF58 family)
VSLTTKGLAYALGGALALFAGLAFDHPVLLGLGLLAAGLVVVALLTVRGAHVTLQRSTGGDTANEGDTVTVDLRITAARKLGKSLLEVRDALPGEVELADGNNYALLDLKAGEGAELRYAVRCPIKGFHTLGPVRVRVEDPFGLYHRDQVLGAQTTIKVYPKVEDLKDAQAKSKYPFVTTGPFLISNPGPGSSFFALREYNRGDSMRDVNWKASARSKNLVVNQKERESQSEVTLLLDARLAGAIGTVRENTFLYTCRAAASLTDLFLANRSKVSLVVYGPGVERINKRNSQNLGMDVLEAVTRAKPAGDTSLAQVIDDILPTIKPKTPIYLLSSLVDDPGIEAAVSSLRAYDCRVLVVAPNAAAFARLATPGKAGAPEAALIEAQRDRTLATLRGMGALGLDWKPGDSLNVSLLTGVI